MLSLTRAVYKGDCGDENCLVFDLPGGRRIRVWLVSMGKPGAVRTLIDAPRDVSISRGELLANPMDCIPDPPKPKGGA